ncbi:hypothetical protein AeMF1_005208 [Aphanomyces euteiches]|nr:hypothetical protein AeMF1_005208 [Aphanomyces euteiches]KAH9183195.1 hypothetical protein AeNC1_014830 [Aphanomyces euteiches]
MTFSAILRQPSEVSTETKLAFVEECLNLLELTDLPLAEPDREAYYRERPKQLLYVVFHGFFLTAIFYPFVGFTGTFGDAVFYGLKACLMIFFNVYMGQSMCYLAPSVEVAALLGISTNSIFFLFMGFNPPAMSIPSDYRWLYNITSQKYSFAAMTASVLAKCEDGQGICCGSCKVAARLNASIEYVYEMKHAEPEAILASSLVSLC